MDLSRVGHRDQLKARREPYWQRLRIGCFVGYRASKRGKAGTWISRVLDPETSKYRIKSLGDLGKMAKNEMFSHAKQETERFSDEIDCGGSPETVLETVEDACRQYALNSLDAEGRFKRYVYGKPIARIKLTKLRRHHLREWRQWLSNEPLKLNDENGRVKTRASSTINRDMVVLRAALNQVVAHGAPNTDLAWQEALKPIRNADRQRSLYLDRRQRIDLISATNDEAVTFVQALCILPLRVGAVAKLRVRDFDIRTSELNIGQDKSGRPRRFQLPPDASELFVKQITEKSADQPIFERKNGKPWDKDSWKKPITEAVAVAGLPDDTTAYTMRHSVITDLVQQNLPLLTIAQISGTSVAMIERHYGHLQSHAAVDALNAISVL